MEALIVANCCSSVLNPLLAFPGPAQFGAPTSSPREPRANP